VFLSETGESNRLSLFHAARSIETELVPCCRKYNIDIVVYNPLAGGLFSGKIKSKDLVPEDGRFSNTAERTGQMYRDRYFKDATFEALRIIEPVASKHNLTLLEIALRWCVHHSELKTRVKGGNDGVIIGVSSIAQLEGNLRDLKKGPLPEDVVQALDDAWLVAKPTTPNYFR
jgi:aflatoxin B1 aldehyde reductase